MHACAVEKCTFKATRKDNIRQHLQKSHPQYRLAPGSRKDKPPVTVSGSILVSQSLCDTQENLEGHQPIVDLPTLMQAVSARNIGLVQRILRIGIDVSVKADDGSTALHCAARAKHIEMIQYLLMAGARLEIKNKKHRTPVHEAVLANCESSFALIFKSGARISPKMFDDIVTHAESVRFLQIVFAISGDSMLDQYGQFLFESAARHNSVPKMDLLLSFSKIDRDWISRNGNIGLFCMVKCGYVAVLQCLLRSTKLDPNLRLGRNRSSTLLHQAVKYEHQDIINLLLVYKATDVNQTDIKNRTVLQSAIRYGKFDITKMLLRHANEFIESRDKTPDWPTETKTLGLAIRSRNPGLFELLLSRLDEGFFSSSALDKSSHSLLQLAVSKDVSEIVQELLRRQDVQSTIGHSIIITLLIRQAALSSFWRIVQSLLDCQKALALGQKYHGTVIARLLIEERSCLNWTDRSGQNLLHKSVQYNDANANGLILACKGVNVNFSDYCGQTALHLAAQENNVVAMQLLLSSPDIKVNSKDNFGHTAMHNIVAWDRHDAFNILSQHKDFDVNARDMRYLWSSNETALQKARRLGHTKMIEMLLACGAQESMEPAVQAEEPNQRMLIGNLLNPELDSHSQPSTSLRSGTPGDRVHEFVDENQNVESNLCTVGSESEVDHDNPWSDEEMLDEDFEDEDMLAENDEEAEYYRLLEDSFS